MKEKVDNNSQCSMHVAAKKKKMSQFTVSEVSFLP